MRVAIDARKLTRIESGMGVHTLNLVRGLLEADPALELLLVRQGGIRTSPSDFASARVEDVSVPFESDSPFTPLALAYLLRGHRYDLFHSPFDLTPRGLVRPLVVTVHDLNWIVDPSHNTPNPVARFFRGTYYRAAIRASMDRATRIIAVSNATRDAIREHAPASASKVRVVPNAFDPRRIAPLSAEETRRALASALDSSDDSRRPYVLTVGQGTPYKNHYNAVRGFLRAFGDRPEYRMILVRRDEEPDRALAKLLRTPPARARVRVLSHVAPDVLNALYRAARIVLHPSYYEGFGLPLIEAMAAGVPVVTSNVSSMPEVAGPAALLVDPADPESIAGALSSLSEDGALRERLINAGHARVALFSSGEAARATLAVYREALEEG
ncbi:MAG TPA: glycosyltransferase family 1 protein [Thermoanaerobaculia bacterium]|jgi:alpha-1,3-rhamnosyl/mannosyltransferase